MIIPRIMMKWKFILVSKLFITLVVVLSCSAAIAQEIKTVPKVDSVNVLPAADSIPTASKATMSRYDSVSKAHSPKVAAIRSAILPGLGQIYNKKYWKLPIVYGALGTCGAIFAYNLKNYRDTRFAYSVKYNMRVHKTDSNKFVNIRRELQPLPEESLRNYRNQFRKDIDYSVLVFILLWGLNVVDASVDAHLKAFDVSPDLSFYLKPGYNGFSGTHGLSLVMKIGR
jgi:hypothetical protein